MSAHPARRRQMLAIAAIELRRRFAGRRLLAMLVIAGIPVALAAARLAAMRLVGSSVAQPAADLAYAVLYHVLILRFTVFFGCMVVFTGLFRGEIVDRSLHYWFLAPVRRSVLAVGKFASGLVAAVAVFGTTTGLTWVALHSASGWRGLLEKLASPEGLGDLLVYLAATAFACLGYGAVFLAVGIVFRQPIVPALAILGWESALFLLPAALKKISVVHYVESLLPVASPVGPLAIIAEPTSPWIAVPGLLAVATAAIAFAARRLERTQILYGAE